MTPSLVVQPSCKTISVYWWRWIVWATLHQMMFSVVPRLLNYCTLPVIKACAPQAIQCKSTTGAHDTYLQGDRINEHWTYITFKELCQALQNRTFREAHQTARRKGDRKAHKGHESLSPLFQYLGWGIDGITCDSGTSTTILDIDWNRCDEFQSPEDTTRSPQTLQFVGKSIWNSIPPLYRRYAMSKTTQQDVLKKCARPFFLRSPEVHGLCANIYDTTFTKSQHLPSSRWWT